MENEMINNVVEVAENEVVQEEVINKVKDLPNGAYFAAGAAAVVGIYGLAKGGVKVYKWAKNEILKRMPVPEIIDAEVTNEEEIVDEVE